MDNFTNREKRSARLRFTERIAELCGFDYDGRINKYGGFLTVFQCESVVKVLEDLKRKVEELTAELERLKQAR